MENQTKKQPKAYGYYVVTGDDKIVAWEEDFYTAVRLGNAKADIFGKIYHIYNCKYKKFVKACSGWRNTYNSGYRFGRW